MIKDKKQFEENDRKDKNEIGINNHKKHQRQCYKELYKQHITSVKPVKRAVAKMKEVQMKYTKGRLKEPTGRVKENTTITLKIKQKKKKD